MKKSKIVLGILAVVLSAVMMFGCAGGNASVGKKYDAVYYSTDEVDVVLQKGESYLYNNGKKVTKNGYYSIEPITADKSGIYTEYFVARRSQNVSITLLKKDGSETPLNNSTAAEISKAFVDVKTDETGLIRTYTAAGFLGIAENGGKTLVKTDGSSVYDKNNYGWEIEDAEYKGGGLFVVTWEDEKAVIKSDGTYVKTVSKEKNPNPFIFYTVGDSVFFLSKEDSSYSSKGELYANGTKIDDDIASVLRVGKFLTYTKTEGNETVRYLVGEDATPSKADFKIYGSMGSGSQLFSQDDKTYIKEWNGETGASKKFRVRELGGDPVGVWYDEIEKVGDAYCGIDGLSVTLFNHNHVSVYSTSDGYKAANYEEYADGKYSLAVLTDKKVEFDVLGKKSEYDLGGKTAALNNFVAYVDHDTVVTAYGSIGDISDYASSGEYLMFGNGNDASVVPLSQAKFLLNGGAAYIASGENEQVTSANKFSVKIIEEDVDLANEAACDAFAAKANAEVYASVVAYGDEGNNSKVVLQYGAPALGAQYKKVVIDNAVGVKQLDNAISTKEKTRYIAVALKNGTSSVYKMTGYGDSLEAKLVLSGIDTGNRFYAVVDALGNSYFITTENGNNAIYDGDGARLLDPKYHVVSVINGIVKVSNGDYFGVVRLGKKAKNAKLIKKIENKTCRLLSSGDFMLSKSGEPYTMYNAKGKKVASNITDYNYLSLSSAYIYGAINASKEKDREYKFARAIVTYTDGKQSTLTLSLKGSETNYRKGGLAL